MTFRVDLDQEEDGRWLAEIIDLARSGWRDFVFAFHDGEEIGPRMLARVAKHTGLRPQDI